jgi:hypothetical protein
VDAFAWGVVGSVAGVVCAAAAIVFGVIPLLHGRQDHRRIPATAQLSGGKAALIGDGTASPRPAVAVDSLAALTPAAADSGRVVRLLADAERIAQSITDDYQKAIALADVAGTLAAIDPHRAARIISEAERAARSIHGIFEAGPNDKASALNYIASALAATAPDHAWLRS